MAYGMLIDTTLCVGCGSCEEACDAANQLPARRDERLSESAFLVVTDHGNEVYSRHQCFHCIDPTCASVCPVGALYKTKEGPVGYDADKCMGCRYCMAACPFRIPTYEWYSPTPRVRKCIMCIDRVTAGKPTACSEACPTGATLFGQRDELLAEAHKRIAAEPKKYIPAVFGEREAGGTSVLYISSVPFEKLALPTNLPQTPMPHYTWEALSHIPAIVTAAVPLLWGVWWITNRRDEVAEAEHGTKTAGKSEEDHA